MGRCLPIGNPPASAEEGAPSGHHRHQTSAARLGCLRVLSTCTLKGPSFACLKQTSERKAEEDAARQLPPRSKFILSFRRCKQEKGAGLRGRLDRQRDARESTLSNTAVSEHQAALCTAYILA